ncbi:unnamed protein product, partial [Closterium sp. NIES-53]
GKPRKTQGIAREESLSANVSQTKAREPQTWNHYASPTSPLPAPSPYSKQAGGLTERCEPASRPAPPVRTGRRVPRPRLPPVPGTHAMALRPSSVPLRVPVPAPPVSSLHAVPDPESDRTRAASPTVSRLLAFVVNDPSFESTAASPLVAELLDFAATCRLGYATALVAESESASPPSVRDECALGTDGDLDAPDILTPRSYAEAITVPYNSHCQAAMDAEMASWKSTGTYIDAAPPSQANIVDGMLIFTVKRPLGSPPAFKARYVARGFMDPPAASLRSPPGASRVARHTEDYTCGSGFTPTTAPSLFLHNDMSLPPFYVIVYKRHTCTDLGPSAPRLLVLLATAHSSVYQPLALSSTFRRVCRADWCIGMLRRGYCVTCASGMGLVLGGRGPVVLTGHADTSWVDDLATQWSSQGYTFSLGCGSVSWQSTHSSSVLSSSCEAEIYAGAMVAQELRWLTYLLTDLGKQPRSPPVLYIDNKAMIALCQEHRMEHRMKHIALRYFVARELQQRGQLRLAYVASRANTADLFTKALPPACFAFLDWSCDHLFSPTLPMGSLLSPGMWACPTLPLLFYRSRASGAWRFSSCLVPGWRVTSFLPIARPVARDSALPVMRPVARDGALPVVRPVARDGALPVVRPVARDGALPVVRPVARDGAATVRPCTTQRLPLEQPPPLLHSVQPPLPHPAPALAAAAPDLPAPTLCSRSAAFSPPTPSSFVSLQPWGGGYGGGGCGGDGWCASLPLLLSFPLLQLPLGGRV